MSETKRYPMCGEEFLAVAKSVRIALLILRN